MIWILLAALGVPIWMVVGVLGGTLWSRRRFKAGDGVFEIAIRDAGEDSWPRMVGYARAVHGVLVVNVGLALLRTRINGVSQVEEIHVDKSPKKIAGAVFRRLTFDDGTSVEAAVSSADAARLDGMMKADR